MRKICINCASCDEHCVCGMTGLLVCPEGCCDGFEQNEDGKEYVKLVKNFGGVVEISKAPKELMEFLDEQLKQFDY